MSWEPEVKEIQMRREKALELGGTERVERHHAEGKFTIRERIEGLLDKSSFLEIGQLTGDAVWEGAKSHNRFEQKVV